MNLKNQRPVLMPLPVVNEFEAVSKAALMDIAWSLATRVSGEENGRAILRELHRERDVVLAIRKQQKDAA